MLGVINGLSKLFQDEQEATVATRTLPGIPQETPDTNHCIIALNQRIADLKATNDGLPRLLYNSLGRKRNQYLIQLAKVTDWETHIESII
jgi:hypothetical protein